MQFRTPAGLDTAQVAQLMAMLAPIVMGVLGRMKQSRGLDANRLPEVLQQSHEQGQREVPGHGGLLDANHDGSVADDLLRMGSSALGGMFGGKKS